MIARICDLLKCDRDDIFVLGKVKNRVHARSLFCYWSVQELRVSQADLSRLLGMSAAAITQSVKRGEALAKEREYSLR